MNGIRVGIVVGGYIVLGALYGVCAGDGSALMKRVFAEEKWYREAKAPERVFEGVLRKEQSPQATAGRWNPVRLVVDEQTTWEVYLGAETGMLDGYVGHRVRITGKPQDVLGHKEIWPAGIARRVPSPDGGQDAVPPAAAPPAQ